MQRSFWLVLALTACTSAAEKERLRDSAMIEQAKADAAAEADFVADSLKLAASISTDTVKEIRLLQDSVWTASDDPTLNTVHAAISGNGHKCLLSETRWPTVAVGDTLTCQWTPAP